MTWLSYIFPQIILRASSRYNRDIRVIEERGQYKLLVNGSRQSGSYIEILWRQAFAAFGLGSLGSGLKASQGLTPSILVLGVAGGTVIHLLRQMYPMATITGVDIDQVMIDVGKRFFGLDSLGSQKVIQGDAKRFVEKTNEHFDLIIVDLFFGREIPSFVSNPPFLRKLKRRLKKDGVIIINFLRELEYGTKSDTLMETLKDIFSSVKDFGIYHNRFFSVK